MKKKERYPKTKHLGKYVAQVAPDIAKMSAKLAEDAVLVNDADREVRAKLYQAWAAGRPVEDRIALVCDLSARFGRREAPLQALHPILCADRDARVSERAAYELARFHWTTDGDPATGPRAVTQMAKISHRDADLSAAMLAGLMRLGDDVAAGVLREVRELLDADRLEIFVGLFVDYVCGEHVAPYASLELLVDWLEKAVEDGDDQTRDTIGKALANIARAIGTATIVERRRRYPTPAISTGLKGYADSRKKSRTQHRKIGRRLSGLGYQLRDVAAIWRESLAMLPDEDDDWKTELGKERALPRLVEEHVKYSPALPDPGTISELLRRKCLTPDDMERAELLAVYEEWARHQHPVGPACVLLPAVMAVSRGNGNVNELLPFLCVDPNPNLVETAARIYGFAVQSAHGKGPVAAYSTLIGIARSLEKRPRNCAAVLAVVLIDGDHRMTDKLHGTWRSFDEPARAWLLERCFTGSSGPPTTTGVDYLLAWLADAVERHATDEALAVATALAGQYRCSVEEQVVRIGPPTGFQPQEETIRSWSPAEYAAERIAGKLGEVLARVTAEKSAEWEPARAAVIVAAERWGAEATASCAA